MITPKAPRPSTPKAPKAAPKAPKAPATPRPRILVLEAGSSAANAVRRAGGEAVTVAPSAADKVAAALARPDVHGLLLTGGGDVNPRLYRRRPRPEVYGVSETRDAVEVAALAHARAAGWPVFGICRGMQIQNVEAGGNMHQHIGGHSGVAHTVEAVEGTTYARAVEGHRGYLVTSLHHQEVGKIGRGYRVAARADDGTVEAIASVDGRCMGVQFHPEMDQGEGYARDLIRWLVVEAATRAGLPVPPRPAYVAPVPRASLYRYTGPGASTSTPARRRGPAVVVAPARAEWAGWCPVDGIRFADALDLADHVALLHPRHAAAQAAAEVAEADAWRNAWEAEDWPPGHPRMSAAEWAAALDAADALDAAE